MKAIPQFCLGILLACATPVGAQTPTMQQEFNPWTGNLSPDGTWRKNGVWVATGGNTFDPARCIMSSTQPGESSSGFVTLRSLANSLNGAEMQTMNKFKYGYYETRLKVTGVGDPANNRGVVVSFFIWDDVSGWEVDIEFLTHGSWITSANSGEVTFNYHLNGQGNVHYHTLPFNPKNGFHRYGILYQPGRLDWTVDGVIVYSVQTPGFTHNNTAYIMMNSWTGNQFWGGLAPTTNADSVYDWVRFYENATSVPGSGQPDLIVTDVGWSPANPATGNAVTFNATIKNQGTAATPAGVIHGVSFWVDGTQVSWDGSSTASLAPGATRVLTASAGPTGSATWTATAGSHTVDAWVDDVNRMVESNENNNHLSEPITVGSGLPAAPSGLIATAVSSSQINLTWTDNANNETGFKIERKTGVGGTWSQIATTGANTTTYNNNSGLTAGTTYYYRVRANNGSGDSGYSNEANATTPASAPCDLIVTAVSWTPANPAAGQAVTFSATIQNQGGTATPGGIIHGVLFTVDGAPVNWSDNNTASLAPGATRVLTANGGPGGSSTWTATAGSHTILANVDDINRIAESNEGNNTLSAPLTVTSLPSPWQTADIGAVGAAGSASHSSGTFTVVGSGADIWGTADEFRYVYQAASGDCEIRARVATQQNTDVWAKSGVMIRETVGATSRHAFMAVTPGNGLAFQYRTATGGSSTHVAGGAGAAPYWVRLVRAGSTITAYKSTNGTSWTTVGSVSVSMTSTVQIGLAVTSHLDGTLNTSTFDSVTATP